MPVERYHRVSFAVATPEQANPKSANRLLDGDAGAAAKFTDVVARMRSLLVGDLELVDQEILRSIKSSVPMIPDLAGHLVNAGGKRLRPMLTLAAARIYDAENDAFIKLAAAVELIHGATLLHDDVVDASALRRGASTANIIWGNKESVLVGDYIFSRAFELMVSAGDLRVLKSLSNASGVIAEGEVLQLTTQQNLAATFETYLAVVKAKTAALFAAATEAGATISGADADQIEALKAYGLNLGIAYQLVDDALDYSGHENALGKSVGDDFRESKMTAPVVFAIEAADEEERSFWTRTIRDGQQLPEDFEVACSLVKNSGATERVFERANDYIKQAVSGIAGLPQSVFKDVLIDLAHSSVARSH